MTQKQLKSHVKESPSINLPLSTAVLWVDNHLKLNNCSAISIFSHHCQNYNVSSEFIANPNPFSMRGSPFRAHSTPPHTAFLFFKLKPDPLSTMGAGRGKIPHSTASTKTEPTQCRCPVVSMREKNIIFQSNSKPSTLNSFESMALKESYQIEQTWECVCFYIKCHL